ncbi:unnamed protein product [Alopecurus aequalis]
MKLLCILSVLLLASVEPAISSYDSIFSFGDSFADTGNGNVVLHEHKTPNPAAHPPYGQTYFGHPTGRSSDGRLIIDFIAQGLGLPLVPPFLTHNESFSQGANFAVRGSTALDVSFFKDIPIASLVVLDTPSSVQFQWFESLKSSLCGGPAQVCPPGFFDKSLFFMGEFGFNDYSFALLGMTLPQVRAIVPDVVKVIADTTERLIKHGAETVVVPGIPPLGCFPANLVFFPGADSAAYEPSTGCLKDFNELSVHHNSLLQEALENVRANHPNALVIYADFFTPVIELVESPGKFGFTENVLSCCCGGGGKYNFNITAGCGMPGATVCERPDTYLFWDGIFTEAAYRHIARGWLHKLSMNNHLRGATYHYPATAKDSA